MIAAKYKKRALEITRKRFAEDIALYAPSNPLDKCGRAALKTPCSGSKLAENHFFMTTSWVVAL